MKNATELLGSINNIYGYVLMALLAIAGLYFSIRTVVVQIRHLPEMMRTLVEQPEKQEGGKKGISAFRAFTVSAASRVGTGNIVGVAVAIALGGPGAIFWMWLFAIVGGATAFVESTLGQLYKVKDKATGAFRGGPAYYIEKGLEKRWLAILFVIAITFTYGFVFNMVQANSITETTSQALKPLIHNSDNMKWVNLALALVISALTAAVIFGGIWRISAVSQVLVPIMAVVYIVLGLYVCIVNGAKIPGAISLIFQCAFGAKQVAGAGIGAAMMIGIRRGLFSNEAGMGSVPNASATAAVSHPVKQGFVQTLGVYFDTLIICSVTAFIILLNNPDYGVDDGAVATQHALAHQLGSWANPVLAVVLFFLAYSSIIGNYYYGECNIQFLTESKKALMWFRILVALCVFGGSLAALDFVWALADISMSIMATINLVAVIPLGGLAIELLRDYNSQKDSGHNPVFHKDSLPQARNVECWD